MTTMNKRRYNYRLTDYSTGKSIVIPDELGRECKDLGIRAEEIIRHYNEYNSLGMKVTYGDGALKAIYLKKLGATKR